MEIMIKLGTGKEQGEKPVLWALQHAEPDPVVETGNGAMPGRQPCPLEKPRQGDHVEDGKDREEKEGEVHSSGTTGGAISTPNVLHAENLVKGPG